MTTIFIGGGNMATALIGGLLARGSVPGSIMVVEPAAEQRARLAARHPGLRLAASAADLAATAPAAIIVLAVKPQQLRDAIRPVVPFIGASNPVVLSIAAGVRLSSLREWLGGYRRIVRAMPNTPALIGAGIAGMYAPPEVDDAARARCAEVLAAGGEVVAVEDEALLDAVTGVSGSGPAYVFHFIEALERAAREQGFDERTARVLAQATVSGAVALARSSDLSPGELRQQVTSRGGTTERALAVLDHERVADAIVAAVAAATLRARELGDAFETPPAR